MTRNTTPDVTWDALAAAGVDGLVERHPDGSYVARVGDERDGITVSFAPAQDADGDDGGEADLGWSVTVERRAGGQLLGGDDYLHVDDAADVPGVVAGLLAEPGG